MTYIIRAFVYIGLFIITLPLRVLSLLDRIFRR